MLLKAVFLGFIQGVSEFLPISSSGHLVIVSHFLNLSDPVLDSNLFDSILHGGSLLAIFVYFHKQILDCVKDRFILKGLFLSTLPTFAFGLLVEPYKDTYLRGLLITALSLIIWGIYMIYSEKNNKETKSIKDLVVKDFLFLGFMQAIALIPGTSRSGITIASAMLLQMKKEDAVNISFVMGFPVIFAAFAYEMKKALSMNDIIHSSILIGGLSSSFIFSLLAIVFLVKFIRKIKFSSFAYYRFVLAALIFMSLWNIL